MDLNDICCTLSLWLSPYVTVWKSGSKRWKIWSDWSIFLSTTALRAVKCRHKSVVSHEIWIYVPPIATSLATPCKFVTGTTYFIDEIGITYSRNTVGACVFHGNNVAVWRSILSEVFVGERAKLVFYKAFKIKKSKFKTWIRTFYHCIIKKRIKHIYFNMFPSIQWAL